MSRREFPVHSPAYLVAYAVVYGYWLAITSHIHFPKRSKS